MSFNSRLSATRLRRLLYPGTDRHIYVGAGRSCQLPRTIVTNLNAITNLAVYRLPLNTRRLPSPRDCTGRPTPLR
jgi:hypothetical protein